MDALLHFDVPVGCFEATPRAIRAEWSPQWAPELEFIVLPFGSVAFRSLPTSFGRGWTHWARSWDRGQFFSAGANNIFSASTCERTPKSCILFWIHVPLHFYFKHWSRYPPSCLSEGTKKIGHSLKLLQLYGRKEFRGCILVLRSRRYWSGS